ncbi:transposable element Tcb1 transposase [Trichonephila clavipes]|nr:transposable element Tcb1 transposase [Trichonephila clavipes]
MLTEESRLALGPDNKHVRIWRKQGTRSQPQNITHSEAEALWSVGPTFVLMDDNAHHHRADIVDDCLESEGIAHMAWPAYSPDLNPIENLSYALGRAVSSRFPPPATLIELKTALQEEWRLLNSAVVDHLIKSMVRSRLPQSRLSRGPHTARFSHDCLHPISNLPDVAPSSDLSPLKHIWDCLGRQVGQLPSWAELEKCPSTVDKDFAGSHTEIVCLNA